MAAYPFLAIGLKLKEIRGSIKQGDFAKKLGINLQQYNRYEKGHAVPPVDVLRRVADHGNKPIDWILERQLKNRLSDTKKAIIRDIINNEAIKTRRKFLGFLENDDRFINEYNYAIEYIKSGEIDALTGEGPRNKFVCPGIDESEGLELAEPEGPPYNAHPELTRMKAQIERIYKGKDDRVIERLKGFLAAIDPGEEGAAEIKKTQNKP